MKIYCFSRMQTQFLFIAAGNKNKLFYSKHNNLIYLESKNAVCHIWKKRI